MPSLHMQYLKVQDVLQKGGAVSPALHHSQHDCVSQGRRVGYQPPPYDSTPCHLNEKSCSTHYASTEFGTNITITYSWKHLMYEDFDRGLFNSWEQEGGPDYLFISPGSHDCYHAPQV